MHPSPDDYARPAAAARVISRSPQADLRVLSRFVVRNLSGSCLEPDQRCAWRYKQKLWNPPSGGTRGVPSHLT
jgi:hypothetical protein